GHVSALMQVVRDYDLFFVDSFTTSRSIIQKIANENWVPNIKRDVFLDNDRDAKAINQQFNQLLRIARIKGIALAIAHPYPQTLAVLKRRLNALESQGFRLVPASQLIKMNMQRFKTWRAFLSP
ncbi:MAG: divergent polysaccharide deacetylase family protein, partial [Thiohalomonadales bacterium]